MQHTTFRDGFAVFTAICSMLFLGALASSAPTTMREPATTTAFSGILFIHYVLAALIVYACVLLTARRMTFAFLLTAAFCIAVPALMFGSSVLAAASFGRACHHLMQETVVTGLSAVLMVAFATRILQPRFAAQKAPRA